MSTDFDPAPKAAPVLAHAGVQGVASGGVLSALRTDRRKHLRRAHFDHEFSAQSASRSIHRPAAGGPTRSAQELIMEIQLNTDKHLDGSEALAASLQARL